MTGLRLPDYHTHTERCGHARGRAEEYVAAARDQGLSAIGVADHLPLAHEPDPDPSLAMPLAELDDYVNEVGALKVEYPGFVLLGVEADYLPASLEVTAALLGRLPLDYVVGSVHFLDGWGFDDPRYVEEYERRSVDEVYRQYLRLVGDAAETGLFDIIGHLDLVKKFGHRASADMTSEWEGLAARLKRAGVAVELNTAGLRKPVGELYPAPEVLKILGRFSVPLTFGSDAHCPDAVGRDFDQAVAAARTAGYQAYVQIGPEGFSEHPLP